MNDTLKAVRATLAQARAEFEATAEALTRGSDLLGDAQLESRRYDLVAATVEQQFAEELADAIAAGRAAPCFAVTSEAAEQARVAAERQARIAAVAVGRLKSAYDAAEAAHKAALAAMNDAVDQALLSEATELVARRKALLLEIDELDNKLKGFSASGGRLPPEHEPNELFVPRHILQARFEARHSKPFGLAAEYTAAWQQRRVDLIAGDLDGAEEQAAA